MEQQSKKKNKFALLLVTQKDNNNIKRRLISSTLVELIAVFLFMVIVAVVCGFLYMSITLDNARKEIVDQMVTITNLTDENEALAIENATLTSKVTVLSETVSMKAANEDAISHETVENALPKGFPLSGSATMEEESEGDPILKFTATQGVNVITTGTGTVSSVDADETYGTKVVVDHGNGYWSVYRNNGTPLVKTGEELGKGYILFTVGEENQELGYQIMKDDTYIDPMLIIDING